MLLPDQFLKLVYLFDHKTAVLWYYNDACLLPYCLLLTPALWPLWLTAGVGPYIRPS